VALPVLSLFPPHAPRIATLSSPLSLQPEDHGSEFIPVKPHRLLSSWIRVARVLKTTVYPAVASRGGAIMRFERVDEDPECEELCLRVVTPLPTITIASGGIRRPAAAPAPRM
jgi:hypothetical protein